MPELQTGREGPVEWALAARARSGEHTSGDRALVTPHPQGTLLAVVDGLGHGGEAAAAAERAVETLRAHDGRELTELVERCHDALRQTRGAVLAVATVSAEGDLTWTGVGNIEAVVVRSEPDRSGREHAVMMGGVAGMRVPRLQPGSARLRTGDCVVLATDGVDAVFAEDLEAGPPPEVAGAILRRHAGGEDDALVLVARWHGAVQR